ncbi:M28 family peptidase [Rhodohalobacter barkolensis]|uniref:Glutamate carboxypeptidase n=1 Tax=Rhodohalobacter barkolensis TaxID=2053187 RepID=A0A2N0VKH3_9BACT|nr:M28 family peptidase [Rhodohalobacter barkolensis]PKD44696.1 glutamate carboxypeptidase [Rhodohalobacter barkolensis]
MMRTFILLLSLPLLLLFSNPLTAQPSTPQSLDGFSQNRVTTQVELEQTLIQALKPEMYREHLYRLTREPNIAGTEENRRVIDYMTESMEEAGLRVDHYDYDVWLPEPGEVKVEIVRPKREPLNNKEYILEEDLYSADERLHHGWNAYSGSGDVTAEVVYANYGTKQDFERLDELGVSVEGKIVIARYGGNFRGYKAKYAEEYGAIGLIIYSDPANGGYVNGPAYPEDKFISESTIQRGSALTTDYYGDPLTPFEPAHPVDGDIDIDRLDPDEVDFHTIPIAPLPYASAQKILEQMDGDPVPDQNWQGGLPFTYRMNSNTPIKVNVKVDQPAELKPITNVIGVIEGSEYPDEWIILGSHFDAWGFGAIDPNSGTAMLLSVADVLGEMVQNGYQPKRSIMIAHWDAEEYLLIGSSEWVEHLTEELDANSILYLNADSAVTGPSFGASSSPSLKKPIIEASKMVQHPDTTLSLYETWAGESDSPSLGNLGGGSDHVGLYMHIGVPAAGISMSQWSPVYHSNYDTFEYYKSHLDGSFSYGPALGGVYGTVALRFAEADLLPYDFERYHEDLVSHLSDIQSKAESYELSIPAELMNEELSEMENLVTQLAENMKNLTASGYANVNRDEINRKLIQLERNFIVDEGMPYSAWLKSIYASPDPYSGYASWMLPAFQYAIEEGFDENEISKWVEIHAEAFKDLNSNISELVDLTSAK